MSQVRNLRAMFESKGDTSPPDRGRSPGVSSTASNSAVLNGTISPRPLSKVRTSFVAIEKDGRIGLLRDHSDESRLSRPRLSPETDAESMSTLADKPVMVSPEEIPTTVHKALASDPILEPLQQPQATNILATSVLPSDSSDDKASERLSPPTPHSLEQSPQPSSKYTQAEPFTPTLAASARKEADHKSRAIIRIPKPPSTNSNTGNMNRAIPSKQAAKPAKTHSSPTPTASLVKKGKISDNKVAPRTTTALSKTAPRSAPAATVKPKVTGRSEPSSIKSKPKSPTKVVHIPSSILAPTESSVSKTSGPRQSLSRQGGYAQNLDIAAISSTRPSLSTAKLVSASNSKSQPSSASHGKPSIGPPPSKRPQQEASAVKRQGQVDEGFLARMMRPTQASSSKMFDKPLQTVAKKTATVRTASTAVCGTLGLDAGALKKALSKDVTVKNYPLSSTDAEVPHLPPEASREAANAREETANMSPRDASGVRTPVTPIDPEPAPESRPTEAMNSGIPAPIELGPINTADFKKFKDTHLGMPAEDDLETTCRPIPSVANMVAPNAASVPSAATTAVDHAACRVMANTGTTTDSSPRSVFQPEQNGAEDDKGYTQSSDQDAISAQDIACDGAQRMRFEIEDAVDQKKHHEDKTDATTDMTTETAVDKAKSELTSTSSSSAASG